MQTSIVRALTVMAVMAVAPHAAQGQGGGSGTLTPFRSDRELSAYLRPLVEEYRAREKARGAQQAAAASCKSLMTVTRGTTASGATEVSGHIRDVYSRLLPGTNVRIPELSLSAIADSTGTFRFAISPDSLTPVRHLTIQARRIGYAAQTVDVHAGEAVAVEFRMCPVQTTLESVVLTGTARLSETITNTQHDGVDEGDIVKLRGDHLIILRRGRLYTVAVNETRLEPIAAVNAFGPDIDGKNDWYDEILTFENKVIVIGYSYERGGTEIGVFHMDDLGRLRYLATYHLRSDDYYSSRNYASRLVGDKLVFYAPLSLPLDGDDPLVALPSLQRWDRRAGGGRFRRIAAVQHIYRAPFPVRLDAGLTMHTITTCDLRAEDLTCDATVVLGPEARVFYTSPTAVYVWTTRPGRAGPHEALVYRLPLDGGAPTALGVAGSPVDQFSFLESPDDHLNVVVRADGAGDGMWASGASAGSVALLRVSLGDFGDGTRSAPVRAYRSLPSPPESTETFENRFVGDHLLYGFGNGWGDAATISSTLYVVPWRGGRLTLVPLPHGVDRIEPMGRDAVVVGADTTDLHFSGIRLDGRPRIEQQYTLRQATQGELRSHGFFYRPNDFRTGVLGLPVGHSGRAGYEHLFTQSASVMFLRNTGEDFERAGELQAHDAAASDDHCEVSCMDWYGNSRPIFIGGRVFALLGNELVEGTIRGPNIVEVRRVNFAHK
jgi:hypothetical protein